MAINPMQRKARNSFLLGMLLMLVIALIVVGILFMQIQGMKKQEQQIAKNSKIVYMLKRDIKSGENITSADVEPKTIETNIANSEIAQTADLIDEKTIAKIDLPKGSFVAKSMITTIDEKVTNDLRIQEFNMILLPTDLSKNDYIDIRITFPNGQDYIVVSKKRVIQLSQNTVFIKLTEDEILTMSNAIVDAYIKEGSNLYANKYEDPGIQTAATPTYPVNNDVLGIISSNPNIVEQARNALWKRYQKELRTNIDTMLVNGAEDSAERIKAGVEEQIQKQQEERARYVETLGNLDY